MIAATTATPAMPPGTDPVLTRDGAEAWLGRRIRKIALLSILAVALTPIASAIVVGGKLWWKAKTLPPPGPLVESTLLWSAIVIPLLLLSAGLIGARYLELARRARPIVRHGQEHVGRVVDVQTSTRTGKGGVRHTKLTVSAATDSYTFAASIEESEGTDLPNVTVGSPATIWTMGTQAIVGTCGALFES